MDNHASHRLIKDALLGHGVAKPGMTFWDELEYVPLPHSCLARFRYSIPYHQKEALWCLNAPLHIQKNVAAKFRSHSRTIMIGVYMVDCSATRDLGMPPSAYNGYDGQSDLQAAMFLNPYHYVESAQVPTVPWALKGALLLNLFQALLQSSVMHRSLTRLRSSDWRTHRKPHPSQRAISDAKFREIAEKALCASTELMAACSNKNDAYLRKMYLACGGQDLMQDEVDVYENNFCNPTFHILSQNLKKSNFLTKLKKANLLGWSFRKQIFLDGALESKPSWMEL